MPRNPFQVKIRRVSAEVIGFPRQWASRRCLFGQSRDGPGSLLQRTGGVRLAEVPQDQGEAVQAGGDVGVVGAAAASSMASARSGSGLASANRACTCR